MQPFPVHHGRMQSILPLHIAIATVAGIKIIVNCFLQYNRGFRKIHEKWKIKWQFFSGSDKIQAECDVVRADSFVLASSQNFSEKGRSVMYCPNCGKHVSDGKNFCRHCGYRMNNDMSGSVSEKKQKRKKSRAPLIAALSAGIVLLTTAGSSVFLFKDRIFHTASAVQNESAGSAAEQTGSGKETAAGTDEDPVSSSAHPVMGDDPASRVKTGGLWYDGQGNLIKKAEYTYDENNQLIREQWYWENGFLAECYCYDRSDDGVWTYYTGYSSTGPCESYGSGFSATDTPESNEKKLSENPGVKAEYDETGHLVSCTYLTESGNVNYRIEYIYGSVGSNPGYTISRQEFPAYAQLGTWEDSHYHSDSLGIDFTLPADWELRSDGQWLCTSLTPEQLSAAGRTELFGSIVSSAAMSVLPTHYLGYPFSAFLREGVSIGAADMELLVVGSKSGAQLILTTEDLAGTGRENMTDPEYSGLVQNVLAETGLTVQDSGAYTFCGVPCSFVATTAQTDETTLCCWIISHNYGGRAASWVIIITESEDMDVEDTLEEIAGFLPT